MKKDKNKGLDKKVKRALRKEIESRLNEQVLRVISEMGFESKRTTKVIEKNSKQLAKRLTTIINENEKSVKPVPNGEKEPSEVQDTSSRNGNVPEFSSPQPITLQENTGDNTENKKPVVPSDATSSPTALDLAEKISAG